MGDGGGMRVAGADKMPTVAPLSHEKKKHSNRLTSVSQQNHQSSFFSKHVILFFLMGFSKKTILTCTLDS